MINGPVVDGGWISSSASTSGTGRVQMRRSDDGGVDVRNSDEPDVVLHYTRDEWEAWLDGVSKREFDHLVPDE